MTVLNRSWKNCLRMWEWISENLPQGFSRFNLEEKEEVINKLKIKWLKNNQFTNVISQHCFFCEYDKHHNDDCSTCPACLVEPGFHCDDDLRSFRFKPIKFYIRILKLNIKRLETK